MSPEKQESKRNFNIAIAKRRAHIIHESKIVIFKLGLRKIVSRQAWSIRVGLYFKLRSTQLELLIYWWFKDLQSPIHSPLEKCPLSTIKIFSRLMTCRWKNNSHDIYKSTLKITKEVLLFAQQI